MNLTPCPVIALSGSAETCHGSRNWGGCPKTSWRQVGGALLAGPQRSKIVPVNPAATRATFNVGSTWCLLYWGGWLPLVWQAKVSRLLQKGQELVCFFRNNSFFFFCRRIMGVRQMVDRSVCSWGLLSIWKCVCANLPECIAHQCKKTPSPFFFSFLAHYLAC